LRCSACDKHDADFVFRGHRWLRRDPHPVLAHPIDSPAIAVADTLQRISSALTLGVFRLTDRGPPAYIPYSIPRPQFHLKRRPAPGPALSAAQLAFEVGQAGIAGPAMQQRRVRNDRLVPAGMAAGAYVMEDAQVLEAEGVARRHGVRAS
jgi:hypothetical protein